MRISPTSQGPLIGLLSVVLLELLRHTPYFAYAPFPISLLSVAVIYAVFTSGVVSGWITSFISVTYLGFFLNVSGAFAINPSDALNRFVSWSFALPIIVYIVGILKRQAASAVLVAERERNTVEANLMLMESNARVSAIIDNASIILWSVDSEGVFTFSDGKGLEQLGVAPGERVGKSIYEIYKNQPAIINGIKLAIKGEATKVLVNLGPLWFEALNTPLKDPSGKVIGVVGASFDVTSRVVATIALKKSQDALETVIRHASVILWSADKNGTITLSEGSGLSAVGLKAGEVVGRSMYEICKNDPLTLDCFHRTLGGDTFTVEHQIGESDLDTNYSPMKNPEGEIIGVVGLSTDITARKRSEVERAELLTREKAALQASEMKSTFLANMSHEIRTPINGVLGMAALLLDTHLTSEQKVYGETIRSSADTLLILVNDILDLSKAEAGKIDLETIDFKLETVISDVEKTLTFSAKSKALKLLRSISTELPPFLKGDPSRLRQVLLNLVNNSIKFTQQGQVTIEASLEKRDAHLFRIKFEVSDTGIGMSKTTLDRMFQAFSQADASTTRKFGGTGLGLSISKHLVNLMGGEIGASSVEGKGSTFWFSIPFEQGQEWENTKQQRSPFVCFDKKLKILLAEDNSVNQMIALKMFEKLGHVAVAVCNGKEAIQALSQETYDLVFMDCQMPELDGYETTRRIRANKNSPSSTIPIIAITANAMGGDREKCLTAGMNDYVSKPMKLTDLIQAITRVLEMQYKESA